MSESESAPVGAESVGGDAARGGRPVNTVEPVLARTRRGPADRDTAQDTVLSSPSPSPSPSTTPGDIPAGVKARYLSEPARVGRSVDFYEGPGAKRAAFRDEGTRLSTDRTHPTLARDLAQVAAHRGWSTVRVRGEDEFRRQVWLEGQALGLEVKGYRPRERDRQELAQRREAQEARTQARERRATAEADRGAPSPAPARKAPEGVLDEVGRAPYRRREGSPVTPYVRLTREGGAPLEVWGRGLPEALARSGVESGDRVAVRRDGVERLGRDRAGAAGLGGGRRPEFEDRAAFAGVDADRFRRSTPAQAARDPDLRGAQSHLAVLDAVIDRLVQDPERRTRLHAEARGIVADEIAQGRRFTPAQVREVEPVLARDVAEAFRREHAPERARAR